MESFTDTAGQQWQNFSELSVRLVAALAVLLAAYLAGRLLAAGISRVMRRLNSHYIHDAFVRTFLLLLCLYFGLIQALNILGLENLALSVLAGGGVTAIVLGFAFREIGENLIAGVFLAFSRPFNVGDLINTEGFEGRVQSIALRYTHLRADDGRDLFIPSSQLFSKTLVNYTRDGLRRYTCKVGIDYANDAKQACALLLGATSRVAGVLQQPPPQALINSLEPSYVELVVHYWRNTFDHQVDAVTLRNDVMDTCRRTLLENHFTVSAETTSNLHLSGTVTSRQQPD